jgi:carbonic anhydrase
MRNQRRFALIVLIVAALTSPLAIAAPSAPSIDGAKALQMILDGNARYAACNLEHPNQTAARRTEVASGQHPFAAILACADSRSAPEIVFDRGVGDLFVVRVAGNVAPPIAVESLDYAVTHLGVRLILILGHSKCGAVTAAVEGHESPGDVGPMLRELRPAVKAVRGKPGDTVANAVRANVEIIARNLAASPELAPMVKTGDLKIAAGVLDIATGKVEMIVN